MLWCASGGFCHGPFLTGGLCLFASFLLAPPPCIVFFRSFAFLPEAYKAVGRALEWDVLGVAQDEAEMAQYREEVGTLADRRWESLTFLMPEKEVTVLFFCIFRDRGNGACTVYLL